MPNDVFPVASNSLSARKRAIQGLADRWADRRDSYIDRNRSYHEQDYSYFRFLIPEGARVLDIGCGTGRLLAALKPSHGVGIDLSPRMIEIARSQHPELEFHVGDVEAPDAND